MRININTFTVPYHNTTINGMAVEGYGGPICVFTDMHKSTHARVRKLAKLPSTTLIDKIIKCLRGIYSRDVEMSMGVSDKPHIVELMDWIKENEACEFSFTVENNVMTVDSIFIDKIDPADHPKFLNFANEFLAEDYKAKTVELVDNNDGLIETINELVAGIDFDKPTTAVETDDGYKLTFDNFGELKFEYDGDDDAVITLVPYSEEVCEKAHAVNLISDDALANVFTIAFEKNFNFRRETVEETQFLLEEFKAVEPTTKGERGQHSSVRDLTGAPDVRFKLPVTPVLYNCTNLQIEVENTRIVKYHSGIVLQDNQYEGDPVIGIIVDFNNPIRGLDNLRAIGNKNPDLPIYILWNSDEGPVLELYEQ